MKAGLNIFLYFFQMKTLGILMGKYSDFIKTTTIFYFEAIYNCQCLTECTKHCFGEGVNGKQC